MPACTPRNFEFGFARSRETGRAAAASLPKSRRVIMVAIVFASAIGRQQSTPTFRSVIRIEFPDMPRLMIAVLLCLCPVLEAQEPCGPLGSPYMRTPMYFGLNHKSGTISDSQ